MSCPPTPPRAASTLAGHKVQGLPLPASYACPEVQHRYVATYHTASLSIYHVISAGGGDNNKQREKERKNERTKQRKKLLTIHYM